MRARTTASIILVALLASVCAVALADAPIARGAAAAGSPGFAWSFRPRFEVVAGANQLARTDGRFALIAQESYRYGGRIIDEATGRTTIFTPPPGCDIAPVINPLGGRWAAAGCGTTQTGTPDEQSYQLYNLRTRTWRLLSPNRGALEALIGCRPSFQGCAAVAPVAIGDQWMEFTVSQDDAHAPPPTYAVQNIWSGEVRRVPSQWLRGGSIVLNLNSPKLAQRLCRPMSLPANRSSLPGTATIEGSFVISTGMVNTGSAPIDNGGNPVEHGALFIQRCGSKRRVQIDTQNLPIAANAHAVLWLHIGTITSQPLSGTRTIRGLLLPSLRRFTVRAPASDVDPILTDRRLYLDNEASKVWRTVRTFPPQRPRAEVRPAVHQEQSRRCSGHGMARPASARPAVLRPGPSRCPLARKAIVSNAHRAP